MVEWCRWTVCVSGVFLILCCVGGGLVGHLWCSGIVVWLGRLEVWWLCSGGGAVGLCLWW